MIVLLFLISPVIIVAVISFNQSRVLSFPPHNVGLGWYQHVYNDAEWRRSLWISIQIALLTTIVATTFGFLAAMALVRSAIKRKMTIYGFVLAPMIVPNIIVSVAFYMAFAKLGASGSIFAIAVGHSVFALPLTTVILTASLQSVDEHFEKAAIGLGASQWQTMRIITLPLASPGLMSAALFAFLTSFDELLISLYLATAQTQTLSVRIWNSLSFEVEPTIAAVSTLLILLTTMILGINALLQRRAE
jgi:ABC-type spermidine/putrescine transport system permease subunit II